MRCQCDFPFFRKFFRAFVHYLAFANILSIASMADVLIVLASADADAFASMPERIALETLAHNREHARVEWATFRQLLDEIDADDDARLWRDTAAHKHARAVADAIASAQPARGWVTAWPEICTALRGTKTIPLDNLLAEMKERAAIMADPGTRQLLVEALKPPSQSADEPRRPPVEFSADCRIVRIGGSEIHFTKMQARAVYEMREGARRGTPDMSTYEILRAAESDMADNEKPRLSDLFKTAKGWNQLIVETRQGIYRLAAW